MYVQSIGNHVWSVLMLCYKDLLVEYTTQLLFMQLMDVILLK